MLTPLRAGGNQSDAFKVQCPRTPLQPSPHPWRSSYQRIGGLVLKGDKFTLFCPFSLRLLPSLTLSLPPLISLPNCVCSHILARALAIREEAIRCRASISQDANVNFCVGVHQVYGKMMTARRLTAMQIIKNKRTGCRAWLVCACTKTVCISHSQRERDSGRQQEVWMGCC